MNKKHARDLVNGGLVTALLIATLASPLAQATAIPAFTSPAIHAGITPSLDQASQWVNADQARTTYGVTGAGLTAAIIDTGINYNHTALGGGFGAGFKVVAGYDFANDDNNPFDTINHGSHVAGIVASTDSTYQGIAPDANLAALKVFTDAGEGIFEYLENALQWTLDNHSTYNISVVNMSLGDEGNYISNPYTDTAVTEKIEQLYNQNIAVVVAAGNGYADAEGMSYPAIVPQTVSVGSVYRQTPPPSPSRLPSDSHPPQAATLPQTFLLQGPPLPLLSMITCLA